MFVVVTPVVTNISWRPPVNTVLVLWSFLNRLYLYNQDVIHGEGGSNTTENIKRGKRRFFYFHNGIMFIAIFLYTAPPNIFLRLLACL